MLTLTGEKLHSYIWHKLPMTRDVIWMVDCLGQKERQPLINKGGLAFEWAPGDPIFDDEDDLDAFDDDYKSELDVPMTMTTCFMTMTMTWTMMILLLSLPIQRIKGA